MSAYVLTESSKSPASTAKINKQLKPGTCLFSAGKPEYVENFMRFIAEELREYMAKLGVKTAK